MNTDRTGRPILAEPWRPDEAPEGSFSRGRILLFGLLALVLAVGAGTAALLSGRGAQQPAQGLVFTIPAGVSVERPGWDSAIAIPTDIRFASPAEAVITITNLDSVAQRAGPFLVGPGQTVTQRFPAPGRYPIVCTVDPLENVVVTVDG